MRKPIRFLISLLLAALAAAALLARRHSGAKDDEDLEEAIELADKAQAQELGTQGRCGVERWAVKTLADRDAGSVDTTPVDATADALASQPLGSPWASFAATPSSHQMPPDVRTLSGGYAETQAYRVKGTLVRYKLESDSDFHIVLADPQTGKTIIVESVDPRCAAGSSFNQTFQNVRDQFLGRFSAPQPDQFTEAGTPVTVVGVRFFDHIHGQNGVAQNGVELHPILCISTGNDCN